MKLAIHHSPVTGLLSSRQYYSDNGTFYNLWTGSLIPKVETGESRVHKTREKLKSLMDAFGDFERASTWKDLVTLYNSVGIYDVHRNKESDELILIRDGLQLSYWPDYLGGLWRMGNPLFLQYINQGRVIVLLSDEGVKYLNSLIPAESREVTV